jgi:phosphoribosylamine--glycine ligase
MSPDIFLKKMKILVLGNGGREHAICKALQKSNRRPDIICFANANNPGIAKIASTIEIGNLMDFAHLIQFAKKEKPDFAILGPDDPIAAGAADELKKIGIESIGPTKKLARLESSKSFTRKLLHKYEIFGNPKFKTFFETEGMEAFAKECGEIVVKFDGLAGGKGVKVQGDHFSNHAQGIQFAHKCLEKSGKVVIEEKLIGQEFSLMFFVDGQSLSPMPVVQDNKRAFSGDKGENTGGMGAVSGKNHMLPFLTEQDIEQAKKIAGDTIGALQAECDEKFKGILFGGFMTTKDGVRLIEFNVRFGDPEALNVLPLLHTDFVDVCEAILNEQLDKINIEFINQATVCKYIVPEGYPESPVKNIPVIFDASELPEEVEVFFASVEQKNDALFLKGSRAIGFTAMADTLSEAQYLAESAIKCVTGPVFHREDIGTAKLMQERTEMMEKIRAKQ